MRGSRGLLRQQSFPEHIPHVDLSTKYETHA
jgi:hypothetical protein